MSYHGMPRMIRAPSGSPDAALFVDGSWGAQRMVRAKDDTHQTMGHIHTVRPPGYHVNHGALMPMPWNWQPRSGNVNWGE